MQWNSSKQSRDEPDKTGRSDLSPLLFNLILISMEDYEVESEKIAIYGNISAETFGKVENFTYLCSKYEE